MFNMCYKPINKDTWHGRIDSISDFDAFRWHQWIKPIDLSKETLPSFSGKLGFALIGFCCDEGIRRNKGRIGAAKGPESIRKELANLPCCFSEEVRIYDAGDIYCKDIALEEAHVLLSQAVSKILNLNLFPIVLGGGHETTFGNYKGVLNYLCEKEARPHIGIINFDAHFDIRSYHDGCNSGTMFRQIADLCKEKDLPYSYFCVGIQKHSNTNYLFKTADNLGVKYILSKDILNSDNWSIFEQLDEFMKMKEHIYITICSDVFSSAYAPGVSATQVLGLDPERVLKFIKYIVKSDKVVSFDICEVSPRFDQDNTTANLAAVIIFSLVSALSQLHNL
ncbi:formimidoylglutamase [Clostridium rectalis]|uniref:formimidoylglutamase n=1 Tax=Clostridium rectalis TaxID=2040295 RepID=UPI000F62E4C7|nr:formimidoylglutamase [Clostridium rectalis]